MLEAAGLGKCGNQARESVRSPAQCLQLGLKERGPLLDGVRREAASTCTSWWGLPRRRGASVRRGLAVEEVRRESGAAI